MASGSSKVYLASGSSSTQFSSGGAHRRLDLEVVAGSGLEALAWAQRQGLMDED